MQPHTQTKNVKLFCADALEANGYSSRPAVFTCSAALSRHYAELMKHIVRSSSRVSNVVLDPFMGSGSTGKACLKLDRQFIGVDMDQHWCEQFVDRTTH